MKVIVPVLERAGLGSRLSDHFGRASHYAVIEVRPDGEVSVDFVDNPRTQGTKPGQYFAELAVDLVAIKEGGGIGRRALEALRQAGVEVVIINAATIEEAIEQLRKGSYRPYAGSGCPGKDGHH